MNADEGRRRLEELFGSRFGALAQQILMLSMSGQPCDVTFFQRKPALDVTIDSQINLAMMYGAGAEALKEKLERIRLSDGEVVSINDIWTLNPMPSGGLSESDLAAVDLATAEETSGPNGETLRKMISDTYHCKTREEEDHFLRV